MNAVGNAMTVQSRPNNQEDRALYLREHDAGDFIAAVEGVQQEKDDMVITALDSFRNEPDVLYVALNYAQDAGVLVVTSPPAKTDQARTLWTSRAPKRRRRRDSALRISTFHRRPSPSAHIAAMAHPSAEQAHY